MRTAAGRIAGESRVNITVRENEIVALQERHDLALATVGKIGSMEQGERCGRQQSFLLAAPRRRLNERREVPLRKVQAVAADFEPAFEEVKLRTFSGAVGAFDDD